MHLFLQVNEETHSAVQLNRESSGTAPGYPYSVCTSTPLDVTYDAWWMCGPMHGRDHTLRWGTELLAISSLMSYCVSTHEPITNSAWNNSALAMTTDLIYSISSKPRYTHCRLSANTREDLWVTSLRCICARYKHSFDLSVCLSVCQVWCRLLTQR